MSDDHRDDRSDARSSGPGRAPRGDGEAGAPGLTRRDLVRTGAAGLGAAALGSLAPGAAGAAESAPGQRWSQRTDLGPAPAVPYAAPPMEVVRIGFVGVGGMGTAHVRNLLGIDGAEIRAVCDVVPEHAERAARLCTEAGGPDPTLYTRGERDFERMCDAEELDLVYTATPWRWHVPVLLAALASGKHGATEVPMAYTVDDCWALVEAAERNQRHCVMMENVCYGRTELMVLNMVRQGVLGEILHGECGYLHDLREIKFADEGEGLWRRAHAIHRNGNLYPTHGLGPVAQCMDINRGDRFDRLVSMSSPSRGLQQYAAASYPAGHAKRGETYELGDVNVSIIQTARGRTIYVSHDTNLPRPYSRINMVQGTRGLFAGYPDRVYIEGRGRSHAWIDEEGYETRDGGRFDLEGIRQEFEHPLWIDLEEMSAGAGHGGMDFVEDYRLIKCLREGLPTDQNVYDGVAWSVVSPLSEISVASGGQPVPFPDFTRGRWRSWEPLGIVRA